MIYVSYVKAQKTGMKIGYLLKSQFLLKQFFRQ